MPGFDFFPTSDGNLAIFLQNFSDKLTTDGKTLGWDDATIQASQARCSRVITALNANEKKLAEYKAQVGATLATKKADLQGLRADIKRIKANPAFTDTIGRDLGIVNVGPIAGVAAGDKAVISGLSAISGGVRVNWKKARWDSVNVYVRLQGSADWRLLGRDTHSPYDDLTPVAKPGTPETREYRIMGVVKDSEIGLPSDIASITVSR